MKFDHIEHTIASYFASALIDGDVTGLEDEEENDFNEWFDSVGAHSHFDISEDTFFDIDEVTGLYANCVTATQFIQIEEQTT